MLLSYLDFDYKTIKSGVYMIKNKKINKIYVGSSKNLHTRIRDHQYKLYKNTHENMYLQKDWNEYGDEFFIVEIIEYVNELNELKNREQYWLDRLKSYHRDKGYNINNFASTKGKTLPKETGLRITKVNTGRKHTEESKAKISLNRKGKYTGERPKHIGKKISKALKGDNSYHLKGEKHSNSKLSEEDVLNIYNKIKNGESILDVAGQFKINKSTVGRIINRKSWKHLNLKPIDYKIPNNSKITASEAKNIKNMIASGIKVKEIAQHFNILGSE